MKVTRATVDQVMEFIKNHDGWMLVDNKLQKTFTFTDFNQAFAFMTSIAEYAEQQNHHPEWFNVYKTVKVDLTTHEVSGISERDFRLAEVMNSVAHQMTTSGKDT